MNNTSMDNSRNNISRFLTENMYSNNDFHSRSISQSPITNNESTPPPVLNEPNDMYNVDSRIHTLLNRYRQRNINRSNELSGLFASNINYRRPYQSQLNNITGNSISNLTTVPPQINRPYRNYSRLPTSRNRLLSFDNLLNNSLSQENAYKNVLSRNGFNQLVFCMFSEEEYLKKEKYKYVNNTCCISQKKFENGEIVIMLPCHHIFNPSDILYWLTEKQAKCPFCRYKLDSVEKKTNNNLPSPPPPPPPPPTSNNVLYDNYIISSQQEPLLTPSNTVIDSSDTDEEIQEMINENNSLTQDIQSSSEDDMVYPIETTDNTSLETTDNTSLETILNSLRNVTMLSSINDISNGTIDSRINFINNVIENDIIENNQLQQILFDSLSLSNTAGQHSNQPNTFMDELATTAVEINNDTGEDMDTSTCDEWDESSGDEL